MPTFGLLLLLIGALALRQVAVGRARDIPSDASDFFSAVVSADTDSMGEVLSRRGENVSADSVDSEVAASFAESADTLTVKGAQTELMKETVKLGLNSSGYALGLEGEGGFYDCSGLIWKAARNIGLNPTFRFTTSNFEKALSGKVEKVSTPAIGDVVLWRSHHMGVLTGNDRLYSARSVAKGIGYSTVSGDTSYFKQQPEYWRIVKP